MELNSSWEGFPKSSEEFVQILNLSELWHLILLRSANNYVLVEEEKEIFVTDTEQRMMAFLLGCYVNTFVGSPPEYVIKAAIKRSSQNS